MRTIGSLALRGLAVALVTLAAVRASAAQQSGAFEVSLPAQPLQLEIPDSGGRTLGETVGSITAFADGIECVSVDVSNLEEDAILQLGLQGQAAECSKAGAIVNFQQDDGIWLSNWFTLEPGTRVELGNFAPIPPCSPDTCQRPGPVTASPSPQPTMVPTVQPTLAPTPSSGAGPISPPDTGSGGLLQSR